jgi:hypothetical protein
MTAMLCSLMVAVLSSFAPQAPATGTPSTPNAAGHWEGTIQVPGQALEVQVDLAARADKGWDGTITIPAQNVKAMPLAGIVVEGTTVTFGMPMVPGSPAFKGTLSADGSTLSGDFTQGGGTVPFSLARKGEARIEAAPKNKPIDKTLEGSWEGTLDANGTRLRLVLKLKNEDGAATGTLTSLDQGGISIPASSIVQAGPHLTVTVPTISGKFEADLKDGRLEGTWTQGPASLPLVLARPVQ